MPTLDEMMMETTGAVLDWDAYFEEFRKAHGEPVLYKRRFLFADGWSYSADDVRGPEYPPPEEECQLFRLMKAYWAVRLEMVEAELRELSQRNSNYENLNRGREIPIPVVGGDEAVERLRGRIDWLKEDVKICQAYIDTLDKRLNDTKTLKQEQ